MSKQQDLEAYRAHAKKSLKAVLELLEGALETLDIADVDEAIQGSDNLAQEALASLEAYLNPEPVELD